MLQPPQLLTFALIGFISLLGCNKGTGESREGRLLAKLGSQELYLSDVQGLVPDGISSTDSLQLLSEYVNRWMRDAAILEEAERIVGKDEEIEILVKDYRASLLRSRYEDRLALDQVDSSITEAQIEELYRTAGDGMRTNTPLIRATLIKVPYPVPEKSDFEAAWFGNESEESTGYLKSYITQYATLSLLNAKDWQPAERIGAMLPTGELGSIRTGTRVSKDENYVYYLRIYEAVNQGEPAPLAYVRDRLHKILLEERRSAFIGEIKERLFADARQQDAVKIYVGNEQ